MDVKKTKNTIIINGKTYDSRTGQQLGGVLPRQQLTVSDMVVSPQKKIAVHIAPSPAAAIATQVIATPQKATAKSHSRQHQPKTAKRKLQHSQTLIRQAVRKPRTQHIHVSQPAEETTTPIAIHRPLLSSSKHIAHQKHAQKITKSHHIAKFATHTTSPATLTRRTANLAVMPQPAREPKSVAVPPPTSTPTEDIFAKALREATSHTQPAPKHVTKTRHRTLRRLARSSIVGVAVVAAVLVVGGSLVLNAQQRHTFAEAAGVAGVAATYPRNLPSGYGRPSIHTAPGEVTLKYSSNSDDRSFSISQQTTSFGARDVLGTDSSRSSISADNGITIYRTANYATWIHGNIRYTVSNATNLSNDQLRDIANNL